MFLSNTTLFYLMVEVYWHLLPKVQLHVSALDNSHLQVVRESLESSYTRFNMGCVQWECGRWGWHENSYVSWRLGFSSGDHSHGRSLKLFIPINNYANFLHFSLVHI